MRFIIPRSSRYICDDVHYATIPKPTCIHSEAQKIARLVTRNLDEKKFNIAYDEAIKILQYEINKARYKAIAGAKKVISE